MASQSFIKGHLLFISIDKASKNPWKTNLKKYLTWNMTKSKHIVGRKHDRKNQLLQSDIFRNEKTSSPLKSAPVLKTSMSGLGNYVRYMHL
jgi:hypothetical protein